jgi:RimJ/RimL family protein N-acetyltransferase
MSLGQEEIPWQVHQEWLNDALKAEGRQVLVGMVGQTAIGIIRFDVRSECQAEVSLYLDPALFGLGLGRSMLLVGEEYMMVHRPEMREFMATVLEHNRASTRMFFSCGYQLREGFWRKNLRSRRVKEVN